MRRDHGPHLQTALWALVIALLLLLPGGSLALVAGRIPELLAPWIDKLVHAGLFFVQALLFRRSLDHLGVRGASRLAVVAAVGYGLLLEILQMAVPERSFEPLDLAADGLGAALAMSTRAFRGW